jgi:hypothetical protein
VPFHTIGPDTAAAGPDGSTAPLHADGHDEVPQPAAANAYTTPADVPTYTTPLAAAGWCDTDAPVAVAPDHSGPHVVCPHPALANEYRRPSPAPT